MKKINIVSVWTWFCNILDTQTLTASEQLVLMHLLKFLNRNFWKPTNISVSALCRSCSKDSRTVKEAITKLKSKGLIFENDEGIFLGFGIDEEKPKRSLSSPKKNRVSELPDFDKAKNIGGIEPSELIESSLVEELKRGGGSFINKKDSDYFKLLNPLAQQRITEKANQTTSKT